MEEKSKFELLRDFVKVFLDMDYTDRYIFYKMLTSKSENNYDYLDANINLKYDLSGDYTKIPSWIRMYSNADDKSIGVEEAIEDIIGDFLTENEGNNNGDANVLSDK